MGARGCGVGARVRGATWPIVLLLRKSKDERSLHPMQLKFFVYLTWFLLNFDKQNGPGNLA